MTQPLRIAFAGTPDFAVPCLEALCAGPDTVCAVITNPDKPSGRGKVLKAPPVKEAALRHNIEVLQPTSVRKRAFRSWLRELQLDLLVVVAYGKILPKSVLDIPRLGCINVHASILPKLRGAAPIQWSIVRGHEETGVSIMQMDEGMDTGDVLHIETLPIQHDDTAGTLHDRLSSLGAQTLMDTLAKLRSGDLRAVPQDHEHATYAPMIQKTDGRIDWTQTAQQIEYMVRGFSPWPGTYTYTDVRGKEKQLRLHSVARVALTEDERAQYASGQIVRASRQHGVVVRAHTDDTYGVSILECQLQGRKRMRIDDFLCGFSWSLGDTLGAETN